MDWIKKKRMEIGLAAAVVLMIAAICIYNKAKYSLQGTTQGRYLTGGVPPVRFSM